jgi:hypothetical protein
MFSSLTCRQQRVKIVGGTFWHKKKNPQVSAANKKFLTVLNADFIA